FVNAVALQSDGKVLVGGDFASFNGAARNRIVRLNADGSVDTSFDPGAGADSAVAEIVVQPDGKILVGGAFTHFGGAARNYFARLNADGSLDTSFDIGSGPNGFVSEVALEPDGDVLVGGFFSQFDGVAANRIARVRGDHTCVTTSTVQFSAAAYSASEGAAVLGASGVGAGVASGAEAEQAASVGEAVVTVTRAGDLSQPAEVDYATRPGSASDRTDYTAAYGTLRFAANERSKSLVILITDDVYKESQESFSVALSNPVGASLGAASAATVNITSDDASTGRNPVERDTLNSDAFVRYHYADFLNRLPDASGLAFWKGQLDQCGSDSHCREVKMVNVSAAFFLSIEFQNTGFLVYRMHQAAFNTGEHLQLSRFLADTQEIRQGVVVGQGAWEQQLETNKQAFARRFVSRAAFLSRYPASMSPAAFVDALNANTGGSLTQSERNALVSQLTTAGNTADARAKVLRSVAENAEFTRRQVNKAFVLMQYYGYLRRNPPDPPDLTLDFSGYNFWLSKLNQFGGDYVRAEMVKAFITSFEYQERFGPR
ncbi:MAG TPA: DUF4214 domain-containing protein, partial [Pyrinomonadaceae bacterium]|nr:DUF4214 domain-containing protein [Pyrinomonadaceae bacterium]